MLRTVTQTTCLSTTDHKTPNEPTKRSGARPSGGRWRQLAAAGLLAASVVGASSRTVTDVHGIPLPEDLYTTEVRCEGGVVATAAAEASEAGAAMLRAGGNAVDATVAAALVLGVVGPFTSGLGGQAYILVHLPNGQAVAIDGSAVAPMTAVPRQVQALIARNEKISHKLAAVPGALAALSTAHQRFGKLSWAEVVAPARDLARFGFRLSPEQVSAISHFVDLFRRVPYLQQLYLDPNLDPWGEDHVYCNDDLAFTLDRIATAGAQDFYVGQIAAMIDEDMRRSGGFVKRFDLASTRTRLMRPVRGTYRGYQVVGYPSPGGGATVIQALQILEHFPSGDLGASGLDGIYVMLESVRVALIDGFYGLLPSQFRDARQISADQAELRARQIRLDGIVPIEELGVGEPAGWLQDGTTQVSVVDRDGAMVALTQSLGRPMGSCAATPGLGFFYNSVLSQFNCGDPMSPAYPQPHKAAETVMAPTILALNGTPVLALGGAGSGRITSSIVETIVNAIDDGETVGEAVARPRALWGDLYKNTVYLELATPGLKLAAIELDCRGFENISALEFPATPRQRRRYGGVNAVMRDPITGVVSGAGDPRRFGSAVAAPSR